MKFHISYLSPALILGALVPTGTAPDEQPTQPGAVSVKAAAKRIDRLVELDLKRAKLEPNAIADDATFLRRAYVGIVGRIPTVAETRGFLNSQTPDKKAVLVDQLLDSPGHTSRMFNYWADLLRVKSRLSNQVSGEPFVHFLKDSIADNKPYNEFVREMVSATGPAHVRGNGATGLLLRDRGMPLDSMANTVRVFLGTRLECAQCHDHPFDRWKQKDFYQMAAFTGGLNYRTDLGRQNMGDGIRNMYAELRRKKDRDGQRALGRMMRTLNSGITGSGTGKIKLPKDYKYDDAKPNEVVNAHAMFGKNPKIQYPATPTKKRGRRLSRREREAEKRKQAMRNRRNRGRLNAPEIDTRATYAEWMTDKSNPRFTKVIANRMWKLAMGRGLIEPVDNILDDTVASNPSLMRQLEKLMVDVDFDLRQFLRVLYNTNTYQREAMRTEVPDDEKYFFQGPMLRRMTGEQMWDSLLTLTMADVDKTIVDPARRAESTYTRYEELINMPADELRKTVNKQKLRYSDPKKYRAMLTAERRKQQRKRQGQARERSQKMAAESAKKRELSRPLYKAYQVAKRAGDQEKMKEVKAKLLAIGIDLDRRPSRRTNSRNRRGRGTMARASEQQHPAPNGHMIRKFGQSDREQIQASHTEANVPQVLSMLNGYLEDRVLSNYSSELMKNIYAASSDREKVRTAYLGVLNREPRGRELAVWEHEMDQGGRKVVKDLVWTLVNSHEFRFVQ